MQIHGKDQSQLIAEIEALRKELDGLRGLEDAPARSVIREERYPAILNGIDEGYYEVDLEGRFTFCNTAMCRMLGYSLSEMPGMHYRACMDGEGRGRSSRSSIGCSGPGLWKGS